MFTFIVYPQYKKKYGNTSKDRKSCICGFGFLILYVGGSGPDEKFVYQVVSFLSFEGFLFHNFGDFLDFEGLFLNFEGFLFLNFGDFLNFEGLFVNVEGFLFLNIGDFLNFGGLFLNFEGFLFLNFGDFHNF